MSALSATKVSIRWASITLAVVALGCGGSTDTQTTSGAGAAGGSGGSSGSGGTGGSDTGGSGGSGGSSGSGGESPDATVGPDSGDVVCGGMVCPPQVFAGMTIPVCCTAQNTCGISVGGTGMCFGTSFPEAGARPDANVGVPDPTCANLMLGGITLNGCCMPDNTCGFNSQLAGCMSLDALRMLGLPGINLPEGGPMSCVFPPPAP